MADDYAPRITRVMQDVNLNAVGRLDRAIRVEYMVGEHGPFTLVLPEAEFTSAKAKELITARAQQLRDLATM